MLQENLTVAEIFQYQAGMIYTALLRVNIFCFARKQFYFSGFNETKLIYLTKKSILILSF